MATSVTWPAAIRLPVFAGYAIEPQPDILRSEMAAGAARQRLVSTDSIDDIVVQWEMTAFEHALFEAWLKRVARGGSLWFTIPLISGFGLSPHEARIKGGRVRMGARNGARWTATATLEIRDRPMLTADELDELLALDESGQGELFVLIAALHDVIDTGLWSD